jgi:hypothetical protein
MIPGGAAMVLMVGKVYARNRSIAIIARGINIKGGAAIICLLGAST